MGLFDTIRDWVDEAEDVVQEKTGVDVGGGGEGDIQDTNEPGGQHLQDTGGGGGVTQREQEAKASIPGEGGGGTSGGTGGGVTQREQEARASFPGGTSDRDDDSGGGGGGSRGGGSSRSRSSSRGGGSSGGTGGTTGGGSGGSEEPVTETRRSVSIPMNKRGQDKQTRKVAGVEGEVTKKAATDLQNAPEEVVHQVNESGGGTSGGPVTAEDVQHTEQEVGRADPSARGDGGQPPQKQGKEGGGQVTDREIRQYAQENDLGDPSEFSARQREIVIQATKRQRQKQGGFTRPEKRNVVIGQRRINAATRLTRARENLEKTRNFPEGSTVEFSSGKTVSKAEAINIMTGRVEEREHQLGVQKRAQEAQAEADIKNGVKKQDNVRELGGIELEKQFAGKIVGQIAESGEVFAEELGKAVTPGDIGDDFIEKNVQDVEGRGVEGKQGKPVESFKQTLPLLTETQRRAVGGYQLMVEENVPKPVQEAAVDAAGRGAQVGTIATTLVTPGLQSYTPVVIQNREQIRTVGEQTAVTLPEATVREIPEKATEFATITNIAARGVQEPRALTLSAAAGAGELVQRTADEPIKFGVAETVPDVGLDLATGGGVAMVAPQAKAQAKAQIEEAVSPKVQERAVFRQRGEGDTVEYVQITSEGEAGFVAEKREVQRGTGEADVMEVVRGPVTQRLRELGAPESLFEQQVSFTVEEATGPEPPAGTVVRRGQVRERLKLPRSIGTSRKGMLGNQRQHQPEVVPPVEPEAPPTSGIEPQVTAELAAPQLQALDTEKLQSGRQEVLQEQFEIQRQEQPQIQGQELQQQAFQQVQEQLQPQIQVQEQLQPVPQTQIQVQEQPQPSIQPLALLFPEREKRQRRKSGKRRQEEQSRFAPTVFSSLEGIVSGKTREELQGETEQGLSPFNIRPLPKGSKNTGSIQSRLKNVVNRD